MVASCHIKLLVLPRAQTSTKRKLQRGSSSRSAPTKGPTPVTRSPSSQSVSGASMVSEWSITAPDVGALRPRTLSKALGETDSETSSMSSRVL